ncbi:MAG: hypothetical protein O9327_05065 [Polaromonas sp.]|nr:hypothetical protein [Polaromonas sp.]
MTNRKTLLKLTVVSACCAGFVNLTSVGQAFAVWCQADAPMVYANMVSNYMPFVQRLTGGIGVSMEDSVIQSGGALRGEILKSATAGKAVAEGLEAYSQQQELRQRAADLADSMEQPATTCKAMATATNLTAATVGSQRSVVQAQGTRMQKLSISGNPNPAAAVDTSFRASGQKFCTNEEARQGICTMASTDPKFAGADRDAAYLFQAPDGSASFDGNGAVQSDATDSYINRVVGGIAPAALPNYGADMYRKSPQARAYVEMARRYNGMQSMSAYALEQIRETYRTKPGLGASTLMANVPGFAAKNDMSMAEVVERFVATKFSPESVQDLAKATQPHVILRDLAQMNSFQLWMSYQAMQQSSVQEGLMAHQLALLTDEVLRPQINAQRAAATRPVGR